MHISKVNNILEVVKSIDRETYDHLERTALYTFALAKELKFGPKQLEQSYLAGLLHDVGVLFSVDRKDKECAEFSSVMIKFVDDDSNIIAEAIKHQHDFYLQEESFLKLLSEIIAIGSKYDELRNVEGLQHDEVLEVLKKHNFKDSVLLSFNEVLEKEELIYLE